MVLFRAHAGAGMTGSRSEALGESSTARRGPVPDARLGAHPSDMQSLDLAGVLRRIRRDMLMSQRELAKASDVSPGTISGIEARHFAPTLPTAETILSAANCSLLVVDSWGSEVHPYSGAGLRDRARRLYPAHLDVREVGPNGEGWWGIHTVQDYIRPRPTHTFFRTRWLYEQFGHAPDPDAG